MFGVRDLLNFEEDPKILDYKVTKIKYPLWVILRTHILFYIQFKKLNLENPHVPVTLNDLPIKEKIEYIYNTIRYHPFVKRNVDILIFGAGINNVLERGVYYNRLYDPFCEVLGDKVFLLESSNKLSYYRPRFLNHFRYSDLINVLQVVLRKFIRVKKCDMDAIHNFINHVTMISKKWFDVDLEEYFTNNMHQLKNLPKRLLIRHTLYSLILRRVKPKIIMIEDAHYGGYTDLIKVAKDFKIKTVEFQHGFIDKNHFAYNWHDNILEQVKAYLPDYMLFWGKYWADKSSLPGTKKIIGFPYLEKKERELRNRRKDIFILLLSSGTIPSEYLKIAAIFKERFPLKNLVFRPHPSERPALYERYGKLIDWGWDIDTGNLYESLSKTEICISLEPTTVLFEALIFCEKVFMLKGKTSIHYITDDLPFYVINDVDELFIQIEKSSRSNITREQLFCSNWEQNFLGFLSEIRDAT